MEYEAQLATLMMMMIKIMIKNVVIIKRNETKNQTIMYKKCIFGGKKA